MKNGGRMITVAGTVDTGFVIESNSVFLPFVDKNMIMWKVNIVPIK